MYASFCYMIQKKIECKPANTWIYLEEKKTQNINGILLLFLLEAFFSIGHTIQISATIDFAYI